MYAMLSSCALEVQARFMETLADTNHSESRLLTAQQAAEVLGVPVRTVYRQAASWPFTRRPAPKTLRFDSGELQRWIASGGRR